MRYRTTLTLFVILLALAGGYFLYLKPMAHERQILKDFEARFFRSDQSKVSHISIDTGDGPVEVSRSAGAWRINLNGWHDADRGVIARLFETLSKGRIVKVVGAAGDEARFGLDEPNVILGVAHAGYLDILKIGDKNPAETGFYASSRRLGKVFLVNREFVREISRLTHQDLRMKRLYNVEPGEVLKVRISRAAGNLELARVDGGRWRMLLPLPSATDASYVESFVETLALQEAEGFLPWDPVLAESLGEPMQLEVFGQDGMTLGAYDVYYWGTEGGRGALIHRRGSVEAMRSRREFHALLAADASVYMYRRLLDFGHEEIRSISLWAEGEGEFTIQRAGDVWSADGKRINAQGMSVLIASLADLKAVRLIENDRQLGMPRWRLEVVTHAGTAWLEVSDFIMDGEVSDSAQFVQVEPGRPITRKVDYLHAHSSRLGFGAIVSSEDIIAVFEMARDISMNGDAQ